ncbi:MULTISPECIES: molybdopterin converting factor subunit 1 [Bacillus]|uniref:Molybdopterin synthase sulfur carrier subunit n=2 Tax=Bacillus cereus TaxID=1396 RepID=J8A634_BACCE|nr:MULTISPECIES: molybdopterin converting factor subunit 1 [Bacillus cereus group]HDR3886689.1 molybdopterin converting factor subunit 1 [Bacillus cereus]EJQ77063.1 molybdopterin converting factor, subunit 1 [Bacillus cereus HuA4-10]EJR04352.1 molybdopterin converting factor, subunit 1 [Bacillus cereus MC67]EOP11036.1 molybdopterin converting factor, subunit 1 [Bacillus cereus MC118]QWG33315.1 molybdopterin converting factor subunit 1 [Bacillus mycoides]
MIEVLLFANLQEEASKPALQIDCEKITVAELKDILVKEYNITISNQIMVAINEEYANKDDIIQTGDIVAMIPPVSGG